MSVTSVEWIIVFPDFNILTREHSGHFFFYFKAKPFSSGFIEEHNLRTKSIALVMLLWRLITSFIGNTQAHLYPHRRSVVTKMRPRESQVSTHSPSRRPASTFNHSFSRWCEFSVSLSVRFYLSTMSLGGKKEYHISFIA